MSSEDNNSFTNLSASNEETDLLICKQFVLDNPNLRITNIDEFCSDDPDKKNPYEDLLLNNKENKLKILSAQEYSIASFCQTCNANSYESNEGPCDCGNDEECKDYNVKSTVYARDTSACFMSCTYQEATDYCKDSKTVMEAFLDCYCCDEVKWAEYTCPTNYACNDGRCVYSPEGIINSVYWSNNEAINGESITMNVLTSNFNNGQEVSFEIYEDDPWADPTGDDYITTKTATINNNKASTNWIVSLTNELYPNNPEYYFKAIISGKNLDSSVIPFRLGHNNYDCEPEPSQKCASTLICDGNTGWTDGENEGCCFDYENWNAENLFCNQAILGKVYSVTTRADGTSQENYYSNKKLLFRFADRTLTPSCGVIDAVISLDNYGDFKLNPEKYVSSWNNNIQCDWTVKSIYVIEGSEIVGSLSNNFHNGWLFGDDSYKDGKRFVKQYIRVHTDKPIWKGNELSISSTSMKTASISEENAPEIDLKSLSSEESTVSSVRWSGSLIIEEENSYELLPKIAGGFRIYLDESLVFDDWGNIKNDSQRNFQIELKEGEHNLTIEYYNLDEKNTPLLMWKTDQETFNPVPSKNLKRTSLDMEKYEKEGSSFKISSFGMEALSQYSNNNKDFQISFIEEPNQLKNLKNPVVLVHGLNGESGYWISDNMDKKLSNSNYDAWSFYYPNNQEINYSSALLSDGISFIRQKTGKSKVSILAHSMGGLVSRGYIENQAITPSGININYRGDVEKLITLGSPFYGSHLANKINFDHWYDFTEELSRWLGSDTRAPAYKDLSVGSKFTWNLNYNQNNTSIAYYTIVGTGDNIVPVPFEDDDSDSLVSVTSANLYYKGATVITFNINHANLKGERAPPQGWLVSYNTDRIITSIVDILNGASESTINSHLNKVDGESYLKKYSIYSDPMPFDRGSILIKTPDNLLVNTIYLKKGDSNYPLVVNPSTGIWYHFDNNILCTSDCGLSLPSGNYKIYINSQDTGKEVSIRPAETVMYEYTICTPKLQNTSWSNWQNISCLSSNLMNQSRYLVQYDANNCREIQNKTIYDYRAVLSCGSQNNNQTNETMSLTVFSPVSKDYNERRIPIEINSSEVVDKIVYIDNADSRARERSLCTRDCDSYGLDRLRTQSFSDGYHNVSFKLIKDDEVVDEEAVEFFIDSKDPRISKTEPRRGFANGEFIAEFTEENPVSLVLHYGNDQTGMRIRESPNGCSGDSRGRTSCTTIVNLEEYNGEEISYWFVLTDKANNTDESRSIKLDVDTVDPVVNSFDYSFYRKYLNLEFNIDELNFDEINYIDWNDRTPRERSICSRLRDNECNTRKSFSTGEHNITINILDDAGNSADPINLVFTCDRYSCFE